MAQEPLVCCICLTRDRPELLKQAIECFEQQNYPNRWLIIWDSSPFDDDVSYHGPRRYYYSGAEPSSIGRMRNSAIDWVSKALRRDPFLVAHWDDDDWSAPTRLAEQVAFMQSSGADIVGYCDLPYYDTVRDRVLLYRSGMTDYSPGTALMYKREVWEYVPFEDHKEGEDHKFQHAAKRQGFRILTESSLRDGSPRMIARLHSANSTNTRNVIEQQLAQGYQPEPNFTIASADLDAAVRSCLSLRNVAQ